MTLILPLVAFFFSAFASILIKNKKVLAAMFVITSLFALFFSVSLVIEKSFNQSYIFGSFTREVGIEYTSSPLKLFVLCFVSFCAFVFAIFLNGFVRVFDKEFSFNFIFCIAQVMCAAAAAVSLTNDLFNFYIFFELFAICAYILCSLGGKGAPYASFNYLFLGIIASGFLVLGIGFLYFSTEYLNITKVHEALVKVKSAKLIAPFAFMLVGFLIKLGIFPFAFWQGPVYKHFPNSMLPFYAAVTSFITFYGFFLFFDKFFIFAASYVKTLVFFLCSAGVLIFSFFSLFETNVKKIFGYSTVSQVAYAFFLLFCANKTLNALAFFHLFSNSISKIALFIITFEVLKDSQTQSIDAFNKLACRSKFVSIVSLFFFANIIGLPISLGFFTKTSIIINLIKDQNYFFPIIILIGAVMNFLYFWRIASAMFYKCTPTESKEIEKLNIRIESKISLIILSFVIIFSIIFFPQILNFLQLSF